MTPPILFRFKQLFAIGRIQKFIFELTQGQLNDPAAIPIHIRLPSEINEHLPPGQLFASMAIGVHPHSV